MSWKNDSHCFELIRQNNQKKAQEFRKMFRFKIGWWRIPQVDSAKDPLACLKEKAP